MIHSHVHAGRSSRFAMIHFFLRFVIPSILAFALSGVYAIVGRLLCGKQRGR